MAQRISTPSVVGIRDEVILTSASSYYDLPLTQRDPWSLVLEALNLRALDPTLIVPALDATLDPPSTPNPYLTYSHLLQRFQGAKGLFVVGPPGSGADYEGSDETPFIEAAAALEDLGGGRVVALSGTYTFSASLSVPEGVSVVGIDPQTVIFQNSADTSIFLLEAEGAGLEGLTLTSPRPLGSAPLVEALGAQTFLRFCRFLDYPNVGLKVRGPRARVLGCRWEDGPLLGSASQSSLWLLGEGALIESCSFGKTSGDLSAVVWVEGDFNGVVNCYWAPLSGSGPALYIIPGADENRVVGCSFMSSGPLNSSWDAGAGTVRYGNTPNSLLTNSNNFIEFLAFYVGQDDISDSVFAFGDTEIPVEGSPGVTYWSEAFTTAAPLPVIPPYDLTWDPRPGLRTPIEVGTVVGTAGGIGVESWTISDTTNFTIDYAGLVRARVRLTSTSPYIFDLTATNFLGSTTLLTQSLTLLAGPPYDFSFTPFGAFASPVPTGASLGVVVAVGATSFTIDDA